MSLSIAKGAAKNLVGTSAALVACAASGAYTAATHVKLAGARKCTLFVAYNAAAIGGYVSILPTLSAHVTSDPGPNGTADAWFSPGVWDGTVTGSTLTASSLPAGTDYTVTPDFAPVLHRPMEFVTEPADVATDKIRESFTFNVEHGLWLRVLYAEAGVTATPGSVWLSYVMHS